MSLQHAHREAVVVRVDARQCEVALADSDQSESIVPAHFRGRLFEERGEDRVPVAVGDHVRLGRDGEEWAVEEILPRRNLFARRSAGEEIRRQLLAANLDQLVTVASFGHPPFSSITTDRILATANFYEVPAILVLNKTDKSKAKKIEPIRKTYEAAGYEVLLTSAKREEGIQELKKCLQDRISLLYGLSGVGKSTLLNCLQPGLGIRTREVSKSLKSGRHTTTYARLYRLAFGGAVIDTPGVRTFRPYGIPPWELRLHFPDLTAVGKGCRFHSCTHREEPECKVVRAVDTEALPESRYRSYLQILDELESIYGGTGRQDP